MHLKESFVFFLYFLGGVLNLNLVRYNNPFEYQRPGTERGVIITMVLQLVSSSPPPNSRELGGANLC